MTSKTAVDETESSWNRRSAERQSSSSAVVGKSVSDKSGSTLSSSRHCAKASERYELIHYTQSRPSNEAKIVKLVQTPR